MAIIMAINGNNKGILMAIKLAMLMVIMAMIMAIMAIRMAINGNNQWQ